MSFWDGLGGGNKVTSDRPIATTKPLNESTISNIFGRHRERSTSQVCLHTLTSEHPRRVEKWGRHRKMSGGTQKIAENTCT